MIESKKAADATDKIFARIKTTLPSFSHVALKTKDNLNVSQSCPTVSPGRSPMSWDHTIFGGRDWQGVKMKKPTTKKRLRTARTQKRRAANRNLKKGKPGG